MRKKMLLNICGFRDNQNGEGRNFGGRVWKRRL